MQRRIEKPMRATSSAAPYIGMVRKALKISCHLTDGWKPSADNQSALETHYLVRSPIANGFCFPVHNSCGSKSVNLYLNPDHIFDKSGVDSNAERGLGYIALHRAP